MSVIAALGAVLGSLGMIAAQLGFTHITDAINTAYNKGTYDNDTVLKTTLQIVEAAKKQGYDKYNETINKLSNLQYPAIMSDRVKDIIRTNRKELNSRATKQQRDLNEVETKLSGLTNRTNAYMSLSDGAKRKNADVLKDLQSESDTLADNIKDKFNLGVEKKV